MGQIKVEKNVGGIEGLCVIEPAVHGDARGYFMETYNEKDMKEAGIDIHFVQDNQSMSAKGVLRGLHFQKQYPQCKLVRAVRGTVFDVAVDLRSNSETYGKWYGVTLSAENKKQFLIPEGFAHGFLVMSDEAEFCYLLDASQTQKECQRLESRNREIDEMFLSLYTDKAKGILTEQRFMKLTATLEQEQEANQKRLQDLAVMQSRADAQESEVRTFIKEIRRYAAIEELDESVLNRLISKILIGEVKKVDGQKVQEVRIVYNFVGEIPEIAA